MKQVHEIKKRLKGELTVPGDKSIGHRAVIFASVAQGESHIINHSGGEDNSRTVRAFKDMGVKIWTQDNVLYALGKGWKGLSMPGRALDCGNSATTMRLLAGVLAGQPFTAMLDGDASLRTRPMKRIMDPLTRMGAEVSGHEGKECAPLTIRGGPIKGIRYHTPVASAQVKSAILLAGLQARGATVVKEPQKSRDHTEIMARAFGAALKVEGCSVSLDGPQTLYGREIKIPGDLSSAAFFMVAAASIPGSDLIVRGVGCNPTRSGIVDVLRRMGASIELIHVREEGYEPVADFRIAAGTRLRGVAVGEDMVARTVDEYPVLAVAASLAEGVTTFCGVGELRSKESDRIAAMTSELRKLGVTVDEREDGMRIEGRGRLKGSRVKSYGDHRVAMSLAVAGLCADGGVEIDDETCADTSFPGFFDLLEGLV